MAPKGALAAWFRDEGGLPPHFGPYIRKTPKRVGFCAP